MAARNPRRVAIARIPKDTARQVSFSKRRQGLFKKVCELSTLCGAESAVLVHSPAGKVYSLGDPDVLTVVDRFLDHTFRPGAEQGESSSGGGRKRQQTSVLPLEGRRRVLEEDLYRQLAEQENWCEEAKVYRAAVVAAMKEKEKGLPHGWDKEVQKLTMEEAEGMAGVLEDLALRVRELIGEKEVEEGVPIDQRWSPDDPAPPPANPWRQAVFTAALGHPAPWNPMGAAADAFGATSSTTPLNPSALEALAAAESHAQQLYLPTGGGMVNPMASVGTSSFAGLPNPPFSFASPAPAPSPPSPPAPPPDDAAAAANPLMMARARRDDDEGPPGDMGPFY